MHNQNCLNCAHSGHTDIQSCLSRELADEDKKTEEDTHVSLGSWCGAGIQLRETGKRKEAYPFDWMTSFDVDGLCKCLDERFVHFTSAEYLIRSDSGTVLNTRYGFDFRHDWTIAAQGPIQQDADHVYIVQKYERRIARFLSLETQHNKVHFYRVPFHASEHIVTDAHCEQIRAALHRLFPTMSFSLYTSIDSSCT